MESLGRFWYYLKATQGPHCCMFNYRTTKNSSRGQDIWREVPEHYHKSSIVAVTSTSSQHLGQLPGVFREPRFCVRNWCVLVWVTLKNLHNLGRPTALHGIHQKVSSFQTIPSLSRTLLFRRYDYIFMSSVTTADDNLKNTIRDGGSTAL